MKTTFETTRPRNLKSLNWLTRLAGWLLLGISIWIGGGSLASQIASAAHGTPNPGNWYHRCRLEVRQAIAIVNYLLTPEDEIGAMALLVDQSKPILPVLGGLTPAPATDTPNVAVAP